VYIAVCDRLLGKEKMDMVTLNHCSFSMRVRCGTVLCALIGLCLLPGCASDEPEPIRLDFSKVETDTTGSTVDEMALKVAIAAMTSPEETLRYYYDLVTIVGQRLGRPTQLVHRKTYAEVNTLLQGGEIDLAFVCSGGYVDAKRRGAAELLVVPVINGKTRYQSYLVVAENSTDSCMADLRGKSFAFTDLLSQTGYRYPVHLVHELGSTPEDFFSSTFFAHGHDKAIQAVARGMTGGACVDGLIYDYLENRNPFLLEGVKVIHRSQPFGIPPVVVPTGLDTELTEQLRRIFLTMDQSEDEIAVLKRLSIDRFENGNDSMYNSVREMSPARQGI
jgi:phosphonate transport system substrate-binding protein